MFAHNSITQPYSPCTHGAYIRYQPHKCQLWRFRNHLPVVQTQDRLPHPPLTNRPRLVEEVEEEEEEEEGVAVEGGVPPRLRRAKNPRAEGLETERTGQRPLQKWTRRNASVDF